MKQPVFHPDYLLLVAFLSVHWRC